MSEDEEDYKALLQAAQNSSVIEWIDQNHVLNERGLPIEFRNHLFLYDIYNDWSQIQAIPKAAQIGFSTLAILKTLFAASKKKHNIIYTLPTVGDANQFVSEKVNQIIRLNPAIAATVIDKDNLEQKKVGERFIYYRGTFTEKAALMFSSDLNVYDEEDRSDPKVIDQYESRLQYSTYKGQWHFSNPSFPNVGSHKFWLLSDMKHWFIKCKSCGLEQYLDWEKNVDFEREIYICQKCHNELTNEDRRVGRWVKKWQGKDVSGYWINQMMACWLTAKELIKAFNDKPKDYFYNFVLGLPYIGSDIVVDADMVLRNVTMVESTKKDVCIGVDVGLEKHVVIGTPYGIFKVFKTKDWGDIEREFLKYDAVMVIDALPDLTEPRRLMRKYKGKVFLNTFKEGTAGNEIITFKKDKDYGVVVSDRTRIIQKFIDELADLNVQFHMKNDELGEYIDHWKSMYRVQEEDKIHNPIIRWESSTNVDHYVFASIYWLIATAKRLQGEGVTIRDNFRRIRGKESYFVVDNKIPSIPITDFIGEEKKDWRYT